MDVKKTQSPLLRSNSSEKCFERGLPYQLTGAGYNFEQYEINRPFGFSNYQWIQTISGQGKIELNSESFVINENEGALLFPKEFHRYYPISEIWKVNWISFDGCLIEKLLKFIGVFESTKIKLTNQYEINKKIYEAVKLIFENVPFAGVDGSVLVYSMILDFHKYSELQNFNTKEKTSLSPVISYINENVRSYFTLTDLAQIINVSEKYLCQLFKKQFGLRPLEYINSLKIKEAKNILKKDSNVKISEVAQTIGIESVSYFSRLFKDVEGISPKKYQIKNS